MMKMILILLHVAALAQILNAATLSYEEALEGPTIATFGPDDKTVQVQCDYGQLSCECPSTATNCDFELFLEESMTFTSFPYVTTINSDGFAMKRIAKGKKGVLYYYDQNGFAATDLPSDDNGPCYINKPHVTEQDFRDINCSIPQIMDGSSMRTAITINGITPGPILIVHEDQVLRLRVHNDLQVDVSDTSIHWHGMFQKITTYMDGMGYVSHPVIKKGKYFDYIFKAEPPGTHWYHSHVDVQRVDGMLAALIVKEANPPSNYTYAADNPGETTMVLMDWDSETSQAKMLRTNLGIGTYEGVPLGKVPTRANHKLAPPPEVENTFSFRKGLINGKGRLNANTFSELSIFTVTKGHQYRFRLVGGAGNNFLRFYIQQHKPKVIASDGFFIEGEDVDFITIHAGERYDFILDADQDIDNYWIKAESFGTDYLEAILHYDGAETPQPSTKYGNVEDRPTVCSENNKCTEINCPVKLYAKTDYTDCLHLDDLDALVSDDNTPDILDADDDNLKFFDFGFKGPSGSSSINSISHKSPINSPFGTNCNQYNEDRDNDDICLTGEQIECVSTVEIAQSTRYIHGGPYPSVNFVFSNMKSSSPHPAHLHGHGFHVAHIGYGKYDEVTGERGDPTVDIECNDLCSNPHYVGDQVPPDIAVKSTAIRKDTIMVPAGGYIVIAFHADNPGYWFMHCHIEGHQLGGMAIIVQEYPYYYQWVPPEDINNRGDFTWTFDQYYQTVDMRSHCPIQTPSRKFRG